MQYALFTTYLAETLVKCIYDDMTTPILPFPPCIKKKEMIA